MKFAIVFMAFIAIGATAVIDRDPKALIDKQIIKIIEDIRDQFPCGFPEQGIPVLDPFKVDAFEFDFELGDALSMNGFIKDSRLTGLGGFVIPKMSFNILTLSLSYEFLFPEISAKGIYDVNGVALIFPFRGHGNYELTANNLKITGKASLNLLGGKYLNLKDFKTKIVLESFVSKLDNIIGDDDLTSDFINKVIEELVPELFIIHEKKINDAIADVVKPAANAVLNQITLSDLIDGIGGGSEGEPWPECIPEIED